MTGDIAWLARNIHLPKCQELYKRNIMLCSYYREAEREREECVS